MPVHCAVCGKLAHYLDTVDLEVYWCHGCGALTTCGPDNDSTDDTYLVRRIQEAARGARLTTVRDQICYAVPERLWRQLCAAAGVAQQGTTAKGG